MEIIKSFPGILLFVCLFLNLSEYDFKFLLQNRFPDEEQNVLGLYLMDFKGRVRVTDVFNYTPAMQAGIEVGDRILEVNGEKVTNVKNFIEKIQEHNEDESIKLMVYRVDSCSKFPVEITPFEYKCK